MFIYILVVLSIIYYHFLTVTTCFYNIFVKNIVIIYLSLLGIVPHAPTSHIFLFGKELLFG